MGIRSQNNPIAAYLDVFSNTGTDAAGAVAAVSGITATGGVISDYPDGGSNIYRAHIFTSSGVFEVTALATGFPNNVDVLSVGGGGGGGYSPSYGGSGGGGGGVHYRTSLPASVATYPITIGAGGAGGASVTAGGSTSSPIIPVTAAGGGGGGAGSSSNGGPGASGGGGNGHPAGSAGPATGASGHPGGIDVVSPTPNANGWGNSGASPNAGGSGGDGSGGGGAGSAGSQQSTSAPPNPGDGGNGARYSTAYGPNNVASYGGGGTGGLHNGPNPDISPLDARPAALRGGGGDGGPNPGNSNADGGPGGPGVSGTGGGGGGAGNKVSLAGRGGSGTFIVRYQIGSVATQKASGGAISFYGGKTIHTFTNSGAFIAPGTFNETIRYVAVGGGGGGGVQHGGGGGAGGYTTADIPLNANGSTVPIAIVIGAGGAGMTSKGSLAGTAGGPENNGNNTTVAFPSPVTAGYGGGGAQLGPPPGSPLGVGANAPLGSGGGGGMKQPGQTGDNKGTGGPQGNHGGSSITYSGGGVGGGGGGAGAVGGNPSSPNPEKGAGGIGVQVHPYFRNPAAAPTGTTPTEPRHAGERGGGLGTPGPAGQFYVAGGGGGGGHTNWPYSVGPNKWGADGGFGGGGKGGMNTPGSETQYHQGTDAVANTGGGGGASGPHDKPAGSGGSGIVLIAYPS